MKPARHPPTLLKPLIASLAGVLILAGAALFISQPGPKPGSMASAQIKSVPLPVPAAIPPAKQDHHAQTSLSQAGPVRVALRQRQHEDNFIQPQTPAIALRGAQLRSEVAFVQDLSTSKVLYAKNSEQARPIASITKLMTALVIAQSKLPMDELLSITDADVDRLRHSRSRLRVGTKLSRTDMLHLALMSSENRAAHALGRSYPGGLPAFVRAMNDKARALGMRNTRFVEPTGLSELNVSTPQDLAKLLKIASKNSLIHRYSTSESHQVALNNGRTLQYNNTNRLVKNNHWDIALSKTGYINEAGQCLVMVANIDGRDLVIVLLNSEGRYSRIGDAVRLREFVERQTKLAML